MADKLKEGEDYYLNEQKLLVFTKTYHLKRGKCCGSGCKNCPFNHINVKGKSTKK